MRKNVVYAEETEGASERETESGAKRTKSHQVKGRREKEMNLSKG